MPYNRRNYLERVKSVQDITIKHTKQGVKQIYIYNNYIKPVYCISLVTYYNYLRVNARKELRELDEKQQKAV